ncbi:hypothetical protein Tco_1239195, partial [Tanacetum coccineum]
VPKRKSTSVAAGCYANILWMKSQLTDYDIIYEKHIDIRYHFIRDHVLKGDIELHFIPTQYQLADIFTKPLDEPTFKRLIVELGGIRGEIGITTFRNALRAHYLSHLRGKTGGHDQISNKHAIILYCLANGVEVDFAKLIWEDIIHKLNKKTREKVVLNPWFISLLLEYMMPEYENDELTLNPTRVFSVLNWALKPNQPEGPSFTEHILAICKAEVPMKFKAPKPSSLAEKKDSHGKNPGARSRLKRKQSSKHIYESKTKASKSKTSHLGKENQSSSALDNNPSQPSASTPVVDEIHKEEQQAAGGPPSLGVTSEEGADPQLSSNKTKSAGDGLKTANINSDEPIIVTDESEEEEAERYEDTHTTSQDVPKETSFPHLPSPKSGQLQELKGQVLLLQS